MLTPHLTERAPHVYERPRHLQRIDIGVGAWVPRRCSACLKVDRREPTPIHKVDDMEGATDIEDRAGQRQGIDRAGRAWPPWPRIARGRVDCRKPGVGSFTSKVVEVATDVDRRAGREDRVHPPVRVRVPRCDVSVSVYRREEIARLTADVPEIAAGIDDAVRHLECAYSVVSVGIPGLRRSG